MSTHDSVSPEVETEAPVERAKAAFPFEDYRQYQQETLEEAATELFTNSVDTLVIDAPTGIGKSPVLMALAKVSGSAFYTTPQKKLRDQLENDDSLRGMHTSLRARRDYRCDSVPPQLQENKEHDCESCPINNDPNESCIDRQCRYWKAKERAMRDAVATITFSFLIADNRLPPTTERMQGSEVVDVQISFQDRDVLIIDEAHTLEEQVASLHAGSKFSEQTLDTQELAFYDVDATSNDDLSSTLREMDVNPYRVFNDRLGEVMRQQSAGTEVSDLSIQQVITVVDAVYEAVTTKMEALDALKLNDIGGSVRSGFESIAWRLKNIVDQVNEGRPWVVDGEQHGRGSYQMEVKPVYVDDFLAENVWSRADQVVLATATLPYRDNPSRWLERIGRDPDNAAIISKAMPFPVENRPIRADYRIGSMSDDGVDEHWSDIIASIKTIAEQHEGEKGLVHTVSYDRADRLHTALPELTMYHDPAEQQNTEAWIQQWQASDKQVFLSPSMTEGVDLYDDRCRFQILLKAPYRNINDPRVDYLLNEGDWEWYHDVTAREIIQSVGRAVRSPDDYATYYVLDEKFAQALDGRMPQWFADAITW